MAPSIKAGRKLAPPGFVMPDDGWDRAARCGATPGCLHCETLLATYRWREPRIDLPLAEAYPMRRKATTATQTQTWHLNFISPVVRTFAQYQISGQTAQVFRISLALALDQSSQHSNRTQRHRDTNTRGNQLITRDTSHRALVAR